MRSSTYTKPYKRMSTSQKSNIRSRWYRANEKPLESGSSSKSSSEPIGEISINENEKLTDDLSGAKPPHASERENRQKRQPNRTNERRRGSSRPRSGANDLKDKDSRHSKDNKREDSRPHPKRKRQPKNREHHNTKRTENSKRKDNGKPNERKKHAESKDKSISAKPAKSKLSSFISKIFGS